MSSSEMSPCLAMRGLYVLAALLVGVATGCGGGGGGEQAPVVVPPAPSLGLFAGDVSGLGNADGIGTAASFSFPSGIASDRAGNLYVADYGNYTVRKITPAGVVTTIAGKAGVTGSDDGIGSNARFYGPTGVAVDATGNIFVTDSRVHNIRKISPTGTVTTVAGIAGMQGQIDGNASLATFSNPAGIAVDSDGTLYVADSYNNAIRAISPQGIVSTWAGTNQGGSDGVGTAAQFTQPTGIAIDSTHNLYVADTGGYVIRKIAPDRTVTTVAGQFRAMGANDGAALNARFYWPTALAVDGDGNVLVTDYMNYTVRRLTPSGMVTTIAGSPGVFGNTDGTGAGASFGQPQGIALGASGEIYVLDDSYGNVRKVTQGGVVTTFAGARSAYGWADGTGAQAIFSNVVGLVTDSVGNMFVADQNNYVIRKITPAGVVSTFAGRPGVTAVAGEANDGDAAVARFFSPLRLAIDKSNNLYVTDGNYLVRKVTAAGMVSTLAGSPNSTGHGDGVGAAAAFFGVDGIATDPSGNVYVSDWGNNSVRKITPDGAVTTVTASVLNWPHGVCVDGGGNIIVADTSNSLIRKVTPSGTVSTVAGGGAGGADGTGTSAGFDHPFDVACDGRGNIYVADKGSHLIRKITSTGVVTTLAGTPGSIGFSSGNLPGVLSNPMGLALAGSDLFFTSNHGVGVIRNLP